MDKEELIKAWLEKSRAYGDTFEQEEWVKACYDWYHMNDRPAGTPPNPIPEGNSQIQAGDLVRWKHTKPDLAPYGIVVSDKMNASGIGIGRGWSAKLQIMWGESGSISTVDRSDIQLCN